MAKFYVWDPDNSERDEAKVVEAYGAYEAVHKQAAILSNKDPFETVTLRVEDADMAVTEFVIEVEMERVFNVTSTRVL